MMILAADYLGTIIQKIGVGFMRSAFDANPAGGLKKYIIFNIHTF